MALTGDGKSKWGILVFASILLLGLMGVPVFAAYAQVTIPPPDQTGVTPLAAPDPATTNPRYLSGFGLDDAYTIFYEDRGDTAGCAFGARIYYNQTTTGAFGFAAASTATNICDTHFVVKDWPITIPAPDPNAGDYAYRGWGAVGNNPSHTFYVSNDLTNWTLISVFTFTDPGGVAPGEGVYYGFHDIVELDGEYYGFAEMNSGRTVIVHSLLGDDVWEVVASVGGLNPAHGPLHLGFFPGITGPTPTGSFLLMQVDGQLVYGKTSMPGDDSGIYLAINPPAAQAATPAAAAAAFADPANWTWRDGSTGLPDADSLILGSTAGAGGHDILETWSPPMSDPSGDWVLLYTGEYDAGGGLGNRAFGCAAVTSDCTVTIPPSAPVMPAATATRQGGADDPFSLPETGFPPGVGTRLPARPSGRPYWETSLRLLIPALGVELPIVGVPLFGGEWDVTWLAGQAGYLEGTAFPTLPGNTALAAHAVAPSGLPGPFANLENLVYGEQVVILSGGSAYIYEVRENLLVRPDDRSPLRHEEYDWLTLITCEAYDALNGTYGYRRVVRAVLVAVESR
ncbi:MAG: sortase [Chloroflexi bacterium]|nr:sortase [Chloroflexota bacterium]